MPEDKTKKSLKYSIYDGISFAVMDGMTASFLTPFAIALNASVNMIAALTYVPQLLGAVFQLFTSKLVEILKDRRNILVASSFMHAVLWIPLLIIPYATPGQKYLLIVYVSLQTILVQLMQPIGNSLLGDLVPKYERGRFFGLRNKAVGATSFISALAAGLTLNFFSPKHPFLGFTILFVIAFLARALSGAFKSMIQDPLPNPEPAEKFSLVDFVKRMDKTNYGHFVIYIVLFKFATYLAAPFFAVYMLKNLGFTYLQFTIIIAAELIASFIAMGIWGRLIDERGTKFVLYTSGMLTPLIPFLWLFSSNFYYLILVELFAGLAWAGFNLSSSNFIFDVVKPENRVRCISYYKFFEGIAIVIGAAFGGVIISHVPSWVLLNGILVVFMISGILRFAISAALLPTLKEARLIEVNVEHSFFKRYLTIRPSEGLVFEVIGKYKKIKEKVREAGKYLKFDKKKLVESNENKEYSRRLVKFIDKNISPRKEQHDLTDMHEIERITEEIEKGKR
ncbi:MFS transporter [Candidatus Woesearchaeota archaeon]|nr:MFS transporter [Candidatus Woesearchaeota archaeon]